MMISSGLELWGISLRFWRVLSAYTLSRMVECLERSGLPVAFSRAAILSNDLNGPLPSADNSTESFVTPLGSLTI